MFLLLINVSFTSSSLFCVWTLVFFSAPMVVHQLQINCHNCSCFCMSLNLEDHRYCDHFILSICPNIRQTLHSDSHDESRQLRWSSGFFHNASTSIQTAQLYKPSWMCRRIKNIISVKSWPNKVMFKNSYFTIKVLINRCSCARCLNMHISISLKRCLLFLHVVWCCMYLLKSNKRIFHTASCISTAVRLLISFIKPAWQHCKNQTVM